MVTGDGSRVGDGRCGHALGISSASAAIHGPLLQHTTPHPLGGPPIRHNIFAGLSPVRAEWIREVCEILADPEFDFAGKRTAGSQRGSFLANTGALIVRLRQWAEAKPLSEKHVGQATLVFQSILELRAGYLELGMLLQAGWMHDLLCNWTCGVLVSQGPQKPITHA